MTEPDPESQEVLLEISFNATVGTNHSQTIHVVGKLKNKNVLILIDGGSTHNFIDQAIVTKYGLLVIQNQKFQVTVANQEKIECIRQC